MKISNLDAAYEIVSKNNGPIELKTLWDKICDYQSLSEEEKQSKFAKFYTQLSLDGRFIALAGNEWDLRVKYTFDKVHLDLSESYYDEENEEEESTEGVDESTLTEKDLFGDKEEETEENSEETEEGSEEEKETTY